MTAQAGGASSPAQSALLHERTALRQQMRQLRRSLSRSQQALAAQQLARQFDRHHLLRPGLRIAVYLALPGEISLHALIERARQRGCHLYVPHIIDRRRRRMKFVRLPPAAKLYRHRWGMPQLRNPPRRSITVRELDLALLPMLAFDAQGHRLGMGGGFYDRHFAGLRQPHSWQRPKLLGVAYALQQVAQIPALAHDVALPWIMTERGLITAHH